jgi:Zn-dependent protease
MIHAFTLLLAALGSMLLHEAAHGDRRGCARRRHAADARPRDVEPARAFDPIMTGIVPVVLWLATAGHFAIGGARPMPITWRALERRSQLVVILAGVWMNAALGLLASTSFGRFAWANEFALLQAWLVILNLLPIPPLDGWRLVQWTRRTL